MPEFHVIVARKNIFPNWGREAGAHAPTAPIATPILHRAIKRIKHQIFVVPVTSSNIGRFSKLFYGYTLTSEFAIK